MKQKDVALLLGVGFFTAIFAFVLSTAIFKSAPNRSTKVPIAGSISTNFPDIRHDPNYSSIFNTSALDPAVPLDANNVPNNQPFNGSSQ